MWLTVCTLLFKIRIFSKAVTRRVTSFLGRLCLYTQVLNNLGLCHITFIIKRITYRNVVFAHKKVMSSESVTFVKPSICRDIVVMNIYGRVRWI
jgi:hypothetical protein